MSVFLGTSVGEIIRPGFVSSAVRVVGSPEQPSSAVDHFFCGIGDDIVAGGGVGPRTGWRSSCSALAHVATPARAQAHCGLPGQAAPGTRQVKLPGRVLCNPDAFSQRAGNQRFVGSRQ